MSSKVTIDCFAESGLLRNGKIISFRDDSDIYKVKNKDYTLYGDYYLGVKWKNNFKELLHGTDVEIYEVEDDKGQRFRIGDSIPSINGRQMLINRFIVTEKEIQAHGAEVVNSFAILSHHTSKNKK